MAFIAEHKQKRGIIQYGLGVSKNYSNPLHWIND
jgi:hypothetical protein